MVADMAGDVGRTLYEIGSVDGVCGCFYKLEVRFGEVLISRALPFGVYKGPLIFGNSHISLRFRPFQEPALPRGSYDPREQSS